MLKRVKVLRDFYIASSAGWQVRGRKGEVIEVAENVHKMLVNSKMAQDMPKRKKRLRKAPEAAQSELDK